MKVLNRNIGRHGLLVLWVTGSLLASGGCSFLEPPPPKSVVADATGPSYTVEYHPQRSKGWQKRFAIAEASNVSDAIEQAGASKLMRKMNVSVIRNVKDTNRVVAMTVVSDGKQVAPNTDYALRDGDRIVIKEDASSPIDRALGMMPEFF